MKELLPGVKIIQMNYWQLEEVCSTGIKESTPGESITDLEQQREQWQRVHAAPVGKDIIKSLIAGLPRIYNRVQMRLKRGIELYNIFLYLFIAYLNLIALEKRSCRIFLNILKVYSVFTKTFFKPQHFTNSFYSLSQEENDYCIFFK